MNGRTAKMLRRLASTTRTSEEVAKKRWQQIPADERGRRRAQAEDFILIASGKR